MARTTLDIDRPILEELKRIKARERKSLGRVASELLAQALASRRAAPKPPKFQWVVKDMRARFDIGDKERLWAELDREQPGAGE